MGMWGDFMRYARYEDILSKSLNQLAAIKSPDVIDNRRAFAHLLLDVYFDALDIPESNNEEERVEELRSIFKPMMDAPKLAPPPGFVEKYNNKR